MNAESVAVKEGLVGDCNRVIVKVANGHVCLTHQDHSSYFLPGYEARSVALRLLRAADQADLIDGVEEA